MQRKLVFAEGEFYHVYNRGVEKREIFKDNNDRERFLRLLYVANATKNFEFRDINDLPLKKINRGDQLVAIGAYCLMPNHFHLLVKETVKGGISLFMGKFCTGYSMYFNKRHKRVGPLFQGRFKAQHANRDEYLKYLFAYIHLNPIKIIEPLWKESGIKDKIRAKRYLNNYRHSSYLDYIGTKREEGTILSVNEFPDYFSDRIKFGDFIYDWLTYGESENGGRS